MSVTTPPDLRPGLHHGTADGISRVSPSVICDCFFPEGTDAGLFWTAHEAFTALRAGLGWDIEVVFDGCAVDDLALPRYVEARLLPGASDPF